MKKKIPTILQYAKALIMTLVLATVVSFAFSLQGLANGAETSTAFQYVGGAFLAILTFQLFLTGMLRNYFPKGALRNDTLVINDTSYAGTVAPYFVLPALFNFDTVVKKTVYMKDGIKKEHTIPTMDFSGPLQPRVAMPTQSGGNLTIDGRKLIPADMMAYQEMNPRNFEVHWDSENLSQTLLTRQLPATAENYIMLMLLGRSFEQFEIMLWQGSTQYQNNANVPQFDAGGAPNPYFQIQFIDGFIKRFLSDSSVNAIASPVALTSSNIGDKLELLYASVTANNKGLLSNDPTRTKMKFLVSYATAQLYEQFLTVQTYKNNDTTERGLNKYKGWEIVPLAGMPDNTIVFTWAESSPSGNLWCGMNSVADENFMLARKRPEGELFFFKMLMKMDVNYGRSEQVFLYTTLTTADFIQ